MTTGGRAADRCARLFSTLEQEQEQDDRNRNWIFRVWYLLTGIDWDNLMIRHTYIQLCIERRKLRDLLMAGVSLLVGP